MTIAVPTYPHIPDAASCKTGQPLSSVTVANPCVDSVNCLGGHMLGGLRAIVYKSASTSNETGTGYLYTYRHPNCLYQDVILYVVDAAGEGGQEISITAGTGTTITWSPVGTTQGKWLAFRAPWGSSDTGVQPITIEITTAVIAKTALWDHPRTILESTDDRLTYQDATYAAIGLMRDHAVAVSSESGPSGITAEVATAWSNHRPQYYGLWLTDDEAITVTGTGYSYKLQDIRCKARQKRSTDTTKNVVIAVRCKNSAASNYTLWATSTSGGSDTVTLSNTTYALNTDLVIPISCTDDDTVSLRAKQTSAGPTAKIQSVSIIEE